MPRNAPHIPVLLDEVIGALAISPGETHVDGTFGAGGYSRAMVAAGANVIAFDRDPDAIAVGRAADVPGLTLVEDRFSRMAAHVEDVDGVTLDIGVSSMQLDQAARGFSFQSDGPLDMRMSQSGETMDTLMAVRHALEAGAKVLAVCNTQGATLAREATATIYTHAGPEVAVASTKAFTAQVTAGQLVALMLAWQRKSHPEPELKAIGLELLTLPRKIKEVLESVSSMGELAKQFANAKSVLFLGRNVAYPIALEGALKLKELAYIHAEGFAAGELKHGPIALIEQGQPVIVIVPSKTGEGSLHSKVVSNIQEIKARGAKVIAIAEVGDTSIGSMADEVFFIPETMPLLAGQLSVIPLQIFAMELASAKGLDVDQPRNLAKSVTVE